MTSGGSKPIGAHTSYKGFDVHYSPGGELSYYDKVKLTIQNHPFDTARDQHDFEFDGDHWGEFCNAHRPDRREKYRVDSFYTLQQIKDTALQRIEVTNSAGKKVELILSPLKINQYETDAVVNAANESLLGGGGCDEEIHTGAGPMLIRECSFLNGCEVGQAVLTKGYDLPANYVIHTVGPLLIDNAHPDTEALASCYRSCYEICEEKHLTSVALPCVACGFYGFPIDTAAKTVMDITKLYTERFGKSLNTIIFSVPDSTKQQAYREAFDRYLEKH